MVGGRITTYSFDPCKKSSWLGADIHGFMYTYMAMLGFGFLLWAFIARFTGVDIAAPLSWLFRLIDNQWGRDAGIWTIIGLSMLPPFLLVFVFRRNFNVMGEQRQFRYLCRWL